MSDAVRKLVVSGPLDQRPGPVGAEPWDADDREAAAGSRLIGPEGDDPWGGLWVSGVGWFSGPWGRSRLELLGQRGLFLVLATSGDEVRPPELPTHEEQRENTQGQENFAEQADGLSRPGDTFLVDG